jgi:AcrR family transcriptional regulator
MKTKSSPPPKRPYNQTARAEAAEATAARILAVFTERLNSGWYDDIRLDQLAAEAGVTVPTILRRFGNKEGLLLAVWQSLETETDTRRITEAGNVVAVVNAVVNDYEAVGDLILRVLSQEDRLPALKEFTDYGRGKHRAWIMEAFAPQLAAMKPARRALATDGLLAALDLYVWKVLRRDRNLSPPEVARVMRQFVNGVLGGE